MIFILLTFLAAFSIEALGTLVSVLGLTSLFGMNAIIVSLAIALDLGKIVVVTLLYSYFKQLGIMMRSYAVIASIITMVITSAGAGSYLTAEFQKAMLGTQEGSLKVQVLKDQQLKYEERKKQIDLQIASLPEKTSVNQRLRLMSGFKTEQQELQNKITEIDKQLPALQINQIGVESKVGPILYIAKAFNIPVEEAVKWVILMIIVVFDPLAVFLIVAGNFLLDQRKLNSMSKPPEMYQLPKMPSANDYHRDHANDKEDIPSTPTPLYPYPDDHLLEDRLSTSSHFLPETKIDIPMPPVKPPTYKSETISEPSEPSCITNDTLPEKCITNDTLEPQCTTGCTDDHLEPLPERKTPVMEHSVFHSVEDEEDPYEHSIEPQAVDETIPETIVDAIPEDSSIQPEEKIVIDQQVTEDSSIQESIHDAIPETIVQTEPERDTITLSSLGYVKADEHTITDTSMNNEIGYKTGAFKSGSH